MVKFTPLKVKLTPLTVKLTRISGKPGPLPIKLNAAADFHRLTTFLATRSLPRHNENISIQS